jgi:hypothetical protein
MKIPKRSVFLLITLLLLNCISKAKKSTTTTVNINSEELTKKSTLIDTVNQKLADSLQKFAKKELALTELHVKNDTLEIVSTMDFLYYPIGKFKSMDKLSQATKKFKSTVETDRSNNKLYRMVYKKSFIKFFYNSDKKAFEVVSGQIYNPEIMLLKKIRIGITLEHFTNIFFQGILSKQLQGIKAIKMISGLDGIVHYYYFDKGVLTFIKLDTDYLFDKN